MARTGCLCADDVCRLEPFWSLQQIKLHRLALIQRTVSVFLDGGEMHEHILSGGTLDETIPLSPVEPFYCSFLSHKKLLSTLLCDLKLPVLREAHASNYPLKEHGSAKGRSFVCCETSARTKGSSVLCRLRKLRRKATEPVMRTRV